MSGFRNCVTSKDFVCKQLKKNCKLDLFNKAADSVQNSRLNVGLMTDLVLEFNSLKTQLSEHSGLQPSGGEGYQ